MVESIRKTTRVFMIEGIAIATAEILLAVKVEVHVDTVAGSAPRALWRCCRWHMWWRSGDSCSRDDGQIRLRLRYNLFDAAHDGHGLS